jgi:hypothetical protein
MVFAGKIKRIVSILLLLILIQKMGGGLYFHNFFHVTGNIEVSDKTQMSAGHLNYSCNCIDDFYLPFTEPATELTLLAPVSHLSFSSTCITSHSDSELFFSPLRGPPACQA